MQILFKKIIIKLHGESKIKKSLYKFNLRIKSNEQRVTVLPKGGRKNKKKITHNFRKFKRNKFFLE